MTTPNRTHHALAWRGLLTLAAAVLAVGCATLRVNSYVERGADLSKYTTFDWGARDGLATGDPRLDNNPFFMNRITSQVESKLAAHGYTKLPGAPDLVVHYHAKVDQQLDANTLDGTAPACDRADCRPFVYDAGTVVIDLVDRSTNRVVWRGWAEGTLDGAIDNQRWMEERIDEAVTRIFERLPNRLATR